MLCQQNSTCRHPIRLLSRFHDHREHAPQTLSFLGFPHTAFHTLARGDFRSNSNTYVRKISQEPSHQHKSRHSLLCNTIGLCSLPFSGEVGAPIPSCSVVAKIRRTATQAGGSQPVQSASLLPPQPIPQRRACRAFHNPNAAPEGLALGGLSGLPAATPLAGSLVTTVFTSWWHTRRAGGTEYLYYQLSQKSSP